MRDLPKKRSEDPLATDDTVTRLLRLRCYERPPTDYYENFLSEFQYRQRAEILKPSVSALLLERFHSWASEFRVPTLAYAGATAVAVMASVAILKVSPTGSVSPSAQPGYALSYNPASFSQAPVTIPNLQPVSLRINPSTGDNGSRVFPTSYLLQSRPAKHEAPLSF